MRAVVLDADGRPQLAEIDEPDDAVDVLACGLCGSDVEKLARQFAGAVLGHEVVVRAGGRRLALEHHRPCGACARCRAGHESTCAQFAAATIVPGGFAERVRATEGVELPETLDDARATMVEPLACVLRGATIGDNTVLGTYCVVNKSLPANVVAGGVPARIIRARKIPRTLRWR